MYTRRQVSCGRGVVYVHPVSKVTRPSMLIRAGLTSLYYRSIINKKKFALIYQQEREAVATPHKAATPSNKRGGVRTPHC